MNAQHVLGMIGKKYFGTSSCVLYREVHYTVCTSLLPRVHYRRFHKLTLCIIAHCRKTDGSCYFYNLLSMPLVGLDDSKYDSLSDKQLHTLAGLIKETYP